MARRPSRTSRSKLVKHAGKVVTHAQVVSCVAKKFKGCSKAEILAVLKVLQRMAAKVK